MKDHTRRTFLGLAPATGFGLGACGGPAGQPEGKPRPPGVPSHLPRRLAICYIGWEWITQALPDEPYGDMERMVNEVVDRGYNCLRAEMALNWMFDPTGQRRGPMRFRGWVEGASGNMQCHGFEKGGGVHDVYERVVRLFELAEKYGLYVIPTSWEYQDALSPVADERIRDEIVGIPYNNRLMLLVNQYDRLLTELKERKLEKRIAFVEVINEFNHPPLLCAGPDWPRQTFAEWVSMRYPSPACPDDQLRKLAHQSVAFLRDRYPNLLITVDYAHSLEFGKWGVDNIQVADHHVYSDGLTQAFWREAGIAGIRPGVRPDPSKNNFLRAHLKPNMMSWEEIERRGAHVRQSWLPIAWLYENLDNEKFDRWCLDHHADYQQRIRDSMQTKYAAAAEFAERQGLPLVVDEGGILYPPQISRFVMTPEGRGDEEAYVDFAIATRHWGILPTGYTRPDTLTWHDESQIEWLKALNRRILES